jgi:hypothetical protein
MKSSLKAGSQIVEYGSQRLIHLLRSPRSVDPDSQRLHSCIRIRIQNVDPDRAERKLNQNFKNKPLSSLSTRLFDLYT